MEEYKNFPQDIKRFFKDHGVLKYKLIQYNNKKRRYCFKIYDGENTYFFKWNSYEPQYYKYYQLLNKELEIYRYLCKTNITPKYHSRFGDFFVTDYLKDQITLRGYIIKYGYNNMTVKLIKIALTKWKRFVKEINNSGINLPVQLIPAQGERHISVLINSGPFGTSSSHLYTVIKKIYRRILMFIYGNNFFMKTSKIIEPRVVHGDFHLNNLIISKNTNEVYLADFECSEYASAEYELAFFMAQIWKLLNNNKKVMCDLNDFIKNEFSKELNLSIYLKAKNLYISAIRFNNRFGK